MVVKYARKKKCGGGESKCEAQAVRLLRDRQSVVRLSEPGGAQQRVSLLGASCGGLSALHVADWSACGDAPLTGDPQPLGLLTTGGATRGGVE